MSTNRPFDIVIFGATGYTGKFAVEDLAQSISKGYTSGIKWAVAGRNQGKLIKTLKEVQDLTGLDLSEISVIEADINDQESLNRMTSQARIIVDVVGPYLLYGEAVVKACIQTKTHFVDLSGEPQFLEQMQTRYHKEAEEAGIFVVGACGFDSIPCDLGTLILQEKFPGELAWVEAYVSTKEGLHGTKVNHGTWDSAANALHNWGSLKDIRDNLYANFYEKETPHYRNRLRRRVIPFVPENQSKLCVPFWDTDRDVVRRTQTYNYIHKKTRPVELMSYLVVGSWLIAIGMGFFGLIFLILSQTKFGLNLLKEYPHIFSGGFFSKDGPSREQVLGSSMEILLVGKGWKDKLPFAEDEPAAPPGEVTMKLQIRGPDAGYVATSSLINQAAVTILQERDRIPFKGGVLTPGLVFKGTCLVDRLEKHKITFKIL